MAPMRAPQSPAALTTRRRADLTARRVDTGDAVPVGQDVEHLGLLEDARAALARRPREPLGRLGGIAVAGVGLVAAGDQILDLEPRLDVVHLVGDTSRVSMPTERWSVTEASIGFRILSSTPSR